MLRLAWFWRPDAILMEPPYLAETEGLEPSEVLSSLFSRQVPNQLGDVSMAESQRLEL